MIPFHCPKGRTITPTEKAELKARWFWGDEEWIKMKQKLDSALSYRKTIKGKPTDEQRIELECKASDVEFYKSRCFIYD